MEQIWSDLNSIIVTPTNLRGKPAKQAVLVPGLKPQNPNSTQENHQNITKTGKNRNISERQ